MFHKKCFIKKIFHKKYLISKNISEKYPTKGMGIGQTPLVGKSVGNKWEKY